MQTKILLVHLDKITSHALYPIFLIYFSFTSVEISLLFKIAICGGALMSLIFNDEIPEIYPNWIFAIGLGISLTMNYFVVPNHYFIIFYVSLFLAFRSSGWLPTFNYPHLLLLIVFALATFQKVISPQFFDGEFIATLFLQKHSLFWVNSYFFTDLQSYSEEFIRNYKQVIQSGPETKILPFHISESFRIYSLVHTYLIAILELILVIILIFSSPKFRYISLLIFIWTTLAFRPELTFFSILCLTALMDPEMHNSQALRRCYVTSFLIFICLGAVSVGVAFH